MLKSETPKKGHLQQMGNINMKKFTHGDVVYVVDAKGNFSMFAIKKLIFNAYTDGKYKKVTLIETTNNSLVTISADSIFSSKEDACKFAIVYLIKRKEPTVKINKMMSALEQYDEIEEKYPELILRHMSDILNL